MEDQLLLKKIVLKHQKFTSNALCFIPAKNDFNPNILAIFTHGYTSSKSDLMSWAIRLSESGITTVIFDLPGHYLGSFNEVESLEDFKLHTHELFLLAYEESLTLLAQNKLELQKNPSLLKIILGGHSLGALMALDCHKIPKLSQNTTYLCVGLGINPNVKVHLFDTDFYKKTLNVRKQLISPALNPKDVFPWIKNHKYNHEMSGEKIVLICGKDDVIVGKGGAANLKSLLEKNNEVELIEPDRLPHHEPNLAAGVIYHYIKDNILSKQS